MVAFKDIDYDLTTQSYSVRIAGCREVIAKPQEGATFGTSDVELTLVEV